MEKIKDWIVGLWDEVIGGKNVYVGNLSKNESGEIQGSFVELNVFLSESKGDFECQ